MSFAYSVILCYNVYMEDTHTQRENDMNTTEQMADALRAAEEFLKIVAVYHSDGALLDGAPDELLREFGECLAVAGGKCSEALTRYTIAQN